MATRDRTALFTQYRNSYGGGGRSSAARQRTAPLGIDAEQKAGLLSGAAGMAGSSLGDGSGAAAAAPSFTIEMTALPPQWLDMVAEVEEEMERIRHNMAQVEQMHKKNLLPGFGDVRAAEESIESLSQTITTQFHQCQLKLKQIAGQSRRAGVAQEERMGKNVQISLATKLQDMSAQFRKSQASYLQKLRGRAKGAPAAAAADILGLDGDSSADFGGDASKPMNMGFTQQQLEVVFNNERKIEERSQEINDVAKSIYQLAEIFRDLQTMVIDQGTLLDRIDYNIEQVSVSVKAAHKELVVGEDYQKKAQGKLLFIGLGLLIAVLLLVLVFKPRRR